ncbi:lysine exporter LysO family protein [Spirabiliibacterium falconis]|uniref:lysine exporter LysO family protein n=1 Tax=Spirabiliibacterium falconis TaxID=572023 RepID=UPI001AAD78F1|nr:lysine exporter LysO family protein [Spirabiliibacterium falconis]MBE2894064.1 lysine exporter LysO family protein [Spirabiliibacterium falconis]
MDGLLIVLCPMIFGYLIKTHNPAILRRLNVGVVGLLYVILFMMGFSLGQIDNLAEKLPIIMHAALTFILCTIGLNVAYLLILDKYYPYQVKKTAASLPPRWRLMLDSLFMLGMVFMGVIVELVSKGHFSLPHNASTYVLVVLIFLVGVQLRNNGISLRQVLFNRRGIVAACGVIITSLIAGILAASWLDFPLIQGLAVASGIGWYSLSSVVINDAFGPVLGSIAFFNDLMREILSLIFVPALMRRFATSAVGFTGATALDCTLPIIQRSGGVQVVPLAISYGFIINLAVPLLLVFFTSLSGS